MISINNFAYMKIKLYIIAIQFVCVLLFAENISILNLPSSTGNPLAMTPATKVLQVCLDKMYVLK